MGDQIHQQTEQGFAQFCTMHEDELDAKLLLLSLEWPSSLSLRKESALTDKELEPLLTFRCRDAQCFKPADRAYVLSEIRRSYGSEEAFDAFVRTRVPEVLRRSKARYSKQLTTVASTALDFMLGAS